MATTTTNSNNLENKTDDEIQAEILAIKKKFYDRMDTQLEKDLILEERERLDDEKRKLDIQKEFLKQKMSRVYHVEKIDDDFPASKANDKQGDEDYEYYDVFKNSSSSSARSVRREEPEVVAQRRNKWECLTMIEFRKHKTSSGVWCCILWPKCQTCDNLTNKF